MPSITSCHTACNSLPKSPPSNSPLETLHLGCLIIGTSESYVCSQFGVSPHSPCSFRELSHPSHSWDYPCCLLLGSHVQPAASCCTCLLGFFPACYWSLPALVVFPWPFVFLLCACLGRVMAYVLHGLDPCWLSSCVPVLAKQGP